MGLYLEHGVQKDDKRNWLEANGNYLGEDFSEDFMRICPTDNVLICLVDNGMFTAAAVAYSRSEALAFADPYDGRYKMWYMVPIEKAKPKCPNWDTYMGDYEYGN